MSDERTFIAIKPDGVQRGLISSILGRFEQRGFKLVGIKLVQPTESLLRTHYEDLQSKPFFPSLLSYMLSGPVLATVWEGKDVVKQGRAILGATNPLQSAPGTIRGDFVMVLILLNLLTKKLTCGSRKKNWLNTNQLCSVGSTNKLAR